MTTTGRIYKISSLQTDNVYIGSTKNDIEKRLKQHKWDYNKFLNNKSHYTTSFEIIKYNDAIIELLEEIEYDDKKKLYERERYFIEALKNTVNKLRPTISKEDKKEFFKQYYIEKQEIFKDKRRKNYIDNREKIKDKQNEKCVCICGKRYSRCNKLYHNKTKKHITYITNNITCQTVNIIKNEE